MCFSCGSHKRTNAKDASSIFEQKNLERIDAILSEKDVEKGFVNLVTTSEYASEIRCSSGSGNSLFLLFRCRFATSLCETNVSA